MTQPFRHARSSRTTSFKVQFLGISLVVLIVFGHYFTQGALTAPVRDLLYPGILYTKSLAEPLGTLTSYFHSKKILTQDNAYLRARVEELERLAPADRLEAYSLASRDTLVETLAQRSALYAESAPRIGSVVRYTDVPFGTLAVIFDDSFENTLSGQLRFVFAEEGSVIGILETFTGKSGVVTLFTRVGSQRQMRIGESELALVSGLGGVTLEAHVPKASLVQIGDPVSLPEAGNALVGSVGEITSADTDTTQRVLIRIAKDPKTIRTILVYE